MGGYSEKQKPTGHLSHHLSTPDHPSGHNPTPSVSIPIEMPDSPPASPQYERDIAVDAIDPQSPVMGEPSLEPLDTLPHTAPYGSPDSIHDAKGIVRDASMDTVDGRSVIRDDTLDMCSDPQCPGIGCDGGSQLALNRASVVHPTVTGALETGPKRPPALRELRRWDTMKLVEAGTERLHTHVRSNVTGASMPSRKDSEITQTQVQTTSQRTASLPSESTDITSNRTTSRRTTSKRNSRKSISGPDVYGMVRKFLRADDLEQSFTFAQVSWLSIWNAVKEEPGHFRYAVWIKSAFLTSVLVLIYSCIRTMSLLKHWTDVYSENRERIVNNLEELNVFMETAGWTDGINSVTKTVIVELYLVADAVILKLKYTAVGGYLLGLGVGLCSLVAVLIQHKRISLAVSDGLHAFRMEAATHNQDIDSPWPSFQKKYPLLGACFFLAILSSTAVVQLHIVGATVSILMALIVNVSKLGVLMDIVGFYLLAYVLVFVIDVVVMRCFKSWLISPDGAHIKHPRWFNFIIVVLSMVHLVIGLLYALWRVLYLLVTTVIVLNRLDVSLFTTGKSLDNGHNAFMSMLVLTVLIQEDHESFSIRSQSRQTVTMNT